MWYVIFHRNEDKPELLSHIEVTNARPSVPGDWYVFYTKREAIDFAEAASFEWNIEHRVKD